jgi:hypothetical protein
MFSDDPALQPFFAALDALANNMEPPLDEEGVVELCARARDRGFHMSKIADDDFDLCVDGPRLCPIHNVCARGLGPKAIAAFASLGFDPNFYSPDAVAGTALHMAIVTGQPPEIYGPALIAAGADISSGGHSRGLTPLHFCAAITTPAAFEWLAFLGERGAALESRNNAGETPVHQAALANNACALERLFDLGADFKALTLADETALHVAARGDRGEAGLFLVSHGADLLARDRAGRTPLHRACHTDSGSASLAIIEAIVLALQHDRAPATLAPLRDDRGRLPSERFAQIPSSFSEFGLFADAKARVIALEESVALRCGLAGVSAGLAAASDEDARARPRGRI